MCWFVFFNRVLLWYSGKIAMTHSLTHTAWLFPEVQRHDFISPFFFLFLSFVTTIWWSESGMHMILLTKKLKKKKQKNSTCWGIGKTVIDNNVSFSICFKSYWSNSPCSGPESKLNICTDGFLKISLLPNYLQSAKTDVISL